MIVIIGSAVSIATHRVGPVAVTLLANDHHFLRVYYIGGRSFITESEHHKLCDLIFFSS